MTERLFSERRFLSTIFCLSLLLVCATDATAASWRHVFFQGTQYPLSVYYLEGEQPGPTIMVQGGVQGDETSGFVTAQLLTRSRVLKGNVIVLPRANVPSINLRRRQVNVDLNRRFDKDYNRFYEDRVARVIRHFLARSQAFIHLHEGSGFYRPKYIDKLRNPKRYGQSVIVDTTIWKDSINLEKLIQPVLDKLNKGIANRDFNFHLFNTKTFDAATPYPEMRKSLTCYALAELNIPALAVEVSKDIVQLDWKVRKQLEATTLLMNQFGVDVIPPAVTREAVRAYAGQGVSVRVNGRALQNGGTIALAPGEALSIESGRTGGEFDPALALFASDRPGVNLLAARRMPLLRFSALELRSDGQAVSRTKVLWRGSMSKIPDSASPVFMCWLNGKPAFVRHGEVLRTVRGDQLILEGIWGSHKKEVVNFKGFVAIPWDNNGQDMGWEIIMDPGNFLDKYKMMTSRPGVLRYKVTRDTKRARKAYFYVDVEPRVVHAIKLAGVDGSATLIPWDSGQRHHLAAGEYALLSSWSNGPEDKVEVLVDGIPLRRGSTFTVANDRKVSVSLRLATTFAAMGDMTLTGAPVPVRRMVKK